MKIYRLCLLLILLPYGGHAQFVDTFDSISPAWIIDRYLPAGFQSVSFDGDNRLQITIDQTGSAINRPPLFSAAFSNTQGEQRTAGITGDWSLSAEVYVSAADDTSTGQLVRSDLWAHTGTTDANGDYAIIGFTNASPTDPLNPTASDRSFRFEVFDNNSGNWFNVGLPAGFVTNAWYSLSEISTGSTFQFFINGVLIQTNPTADGVNLQTGAIEAYNFGQTDINGLNSYSVDWDNAIAAAVVPEPASFALLGGLVILGFAWTMRRAPQKQ